MTDKEIGELWEWVAITDPYDGKVHNSEVVELIRKLVEERARRYRAGWQDMDRGYVAAQASDTKTRALRDFGIDPKDFS